MMGHRRRDRGSRRSFTLTELLVVIGLIVLLVGLLLAALGKVQAAGKRVRTIGTMQAFLNACNTFRTEHGFNPGLVPGHILALNIHEVAHDSPGVAISGTENALLHLLGGYVLESDPDYATLPAEWVEFDMLAPDGAPNFKFKVSLQHIGEGPVINGKPYAPYLAVQDLDLRIVDEEFKQWGRNGENEQRTRLPDLLDAWGTPIIYLRRAREMGRLAGSAHPHTFPRSVVSLLPVFYVDPTWPYVRAEGQMWVDPALGGDASGSILSTGYDNNPGLGIHDVERGLAFILRSDGAPRDTYGDDPLYGLTPRGNLMVISAGEDGIYFSGIDGPGSTTAPIGSNDYRYSDFVDEDQSVLDSFDDIRISG